MITPPLSRLIIGLVLLFAPAYTVSADTLPTTQEAQKALNLAMRAQPMILNGSIRSGAVKHAVKVMTTDWLVTYQFQDQSLRILTLLGPSRKVVETGINGDPAKVLTGNALRGSVLHTDVTYEDLGLLFTLYPPAPGGISQDSIDALPAWRFEVIAPSWSSYSRVRLWMSSEFYALLRVDALDANGQVVKRLEITNVARAGDTYILKEMMISSMSPGRNLAHSKTYIDVDSYTRL